MWSRVVDACGHLADRFGCSVPTVVLGGAAAVVVVAAAAAWFFGDDPPPPELTIPYAPSAAPNAAASEASSTGTNGSMIQPGDGGHSTAEPHPAEAGSEGDVDGATEVLVHAAGAVHHPGVYSLPDGSRVGDLLTAAGGPTPGADLDRVNLAAPVADGTRVYVPAEGEDEPPPVVVDGGPAGSGGRGGAPIGGSDPGGLIDLNRAGPTELEVLPGVGPTTAAAIVEHREANGPFARVEDLLAVRGIGDAKLAAIRDLVHV